MGQKCFRGVCSHCCPGNPTVKTCHEHPRCSPTTQDEFAATFGGDKAVPIRAILDEVQVHQQAMAQLRKQLAQTTGQKGGKPENKAGKPDDKGNKNAEKSKDKVKKGPDAEATEE